MTGIVVINSVFLGLINALSEVQYGVKITGELCDQVVEKTMPAVSYLNLLMPSGHYDSNYLWAFISVVFVFQNTTRISVPGIIHTCRVLTIQVAI